MFFNGHFTLHLLVYLCISAAAYTWWALLAGGPVLAHWCLNSSVLFFSSPLFPSLSLSQWCVQKRKSSSSVHLMVSTSSKLPAIRASAILMPCTLSLCSSPYIACLCRGVVGGRGGKSFCTERSVYSLKGPMIVWPPAHHTVPILCTKSTAGSAVWLGCSECEMKKGSGSPWLSGASVCLAWT